MPSTFPPPFYRWRPHPWHGLDAGPEPPRLVHAYIELTPFDLVKYEVDKVTGYLRIARPQRSSSQPPALYGFVPRTFCGRRVGSLSPQAERGDGDPYGPPERRRARCEGNKHQADAADRKTEGKQFSNVSHVWFLLAGEPVVDGVGVADLGTASTAPAAVTATTVRRSSWLMRLSLRV